MGPNRGKGRGGNKHGQHGQSSHSFNLNQRPRSLSVKRQRTEDSSSDISDFISNVSKDENTLKTFISELLKNQVIKDVLVSTFQAELTEQLQTRINSLEDRLEEMEQYSRRTCLKFCGVHEPVDDQTEDTDELILKIINTDILKHSEQKLTLEHIGRSHRLGKRKPDVPRNIIVRFSIYRYRALVYRNKRYLKESNDIPGNTSKIYVNEALTTKRVNLFKQTRKLYNDKLIKNCWTSDGRIFVRNKEDTQTVLISTESDLSQFFNIRIQNTNGNLSIIHPSQQDFAGALNASAPIFRPGSFTSTPTARDSDRARSRQSSKSN